RGAAGSGTRTRGIVARRVIWRRCRPGGRRARVARPGGRGARVAGAGGGVAGGVGATTGVVSVRARVTALPLPGRRVLPDVALGRTAEILGVVHPQVLVVVELVEVVVVDVDVDVAVHVHVV